MSQLQSTIQNSEAYHEERRQQPAEQVVPEHHEMVKQELMETQGRLQAQYDMQNEASARQESYMKHLRDQLFKKERELEGARNVASTLEKRMKFMKQNMEGLHNVAHNAASLYNVEYKQRQIAENRARSERIRGRRTGSKMLRKV